MLMMCVSCFQVTEHESSSTEVDAETVADTTYYEMATFAKEYGSCEVDTSAYCTRINLSYPEFKFTQNDEAAAKINESIRTHIINQMFPDTVEKKTIETAAERFINDYKEIKAAFGEAFGWYAKINGDVLRNDSSVVTVEVATDIYTGGAHGNFNQQYMNFDPQTGKRIPLESIFQSGYEQQLNKVVEKKFRATYNVSPDKDLSDEGYQFEEGKYYNPNNFALLENGIKFYYNSYEIAPYSSGPSEIFVPYKELKSILKEEKVAV